VSWARDALIALKRIMLLEERIVSLTEQSKRRLVRLEAKFDLLERMAVSPSRRALPEKSQK